jgi:hypothetical protein
MKILIIIAVGLLFTCCEKENRTNDFIDLKGTWYNTESDFDAIIFQNDSTLERKNLITGSVKDYYKIQLNSEEIVLKYQGWDRIDVPSRKLRYNLNKTNDTLVIENLNQYYPFILGNKFYKTKD